MFYFAYGSNMSTTQMDNRVGNYKVIGKGILKNYMWFINSRGYANVKPLIGASVEGIIFELDQEAIQKLDRYEGVHKGLYHRETHLVYNHSQLYPCIVYVDYDAKLGEPQEEYILRLDQAFEEANLDPEYTKLCKIKYSD